jgi:CRP-like cAMP-binding protein
MSDIEKILPKLKTISLFKAFAEDEVSLRKLASIMEIRRFAAGDRIIIEGEQGDNMFILSKGSVSVEKRTLKDDSYTVVKLVESMNVFFGELALMDDDVRSATVMSETDCECFSIRKADFERLGDENPVIGLKVTREIAKILGARLRNSSRDNIILFEALVSEIEDVE